MVAAAEGEARDRGVQHHEIKDGSGRIGTRGLRGQTTAGGGPRREAATGGVPEECAPGWIDTVTGSLRHALVDGRGDIGHRGGPREFIGAVFDTPHGEAMGSELTRTGLFDIQSPDRAPVATVDEDDEGWAVTVGDEPFTELSRMLAVRLDEAAHLRPGVASGLQPRASNRDNWSRGARGRSE